jgi:integrase/recombinase XerD
MSGLRQAAEDYLALRRSLGFALATPGRQVRQFAAYLDSLGAAHVMAGPSRGRPARPAPHPIITGFA